MPGLPKNERLANYLAGRLNELIDEIGLPDGAGRTTTSVILATKVEH